MVTPLNGTRALLTDPARAGTVGGLGEQRTQEHRVNEPRPRRTPPVIRRAVGLAGTALAAAALLAWAPPTSGWNQGAAEGTLWQLMNGARVSNGRQAVLQHGTLVSLARWRSKDQVQRDYFSHTILGTGYQVYHWYDTNGLSYSWGGENIGWNSGASDADSPVMIHEGFMSSPGHRANVLEPSFTHGGVGAYGADGVSFLGKLRDPRFYTELFMAARSAPPPPPPPPPGNPNPPPPPSDGGTAAPVAGPAGHRREARAYRVDRLDAPGSVRDVGEATLVASLDRDSTAAAARALARTRELDATLAAPAEVAAAAPLRIEAATDDDGGLVETVLGSLLGFFL
jgi:uncharacterized protein YkwD